MNDAVPSFPPLLGYVPRDFIGQGGQSTIYRALNLSTNLFAALKVVPFSLHHQQELQQKQKQLVREMRIHETLKHRNVLRLFGGETRQACRVERRGGMKTEWPMGLYMVLDLADGGDLFDKITPDVGVDPEVAHFYFRQLTSGLKYLGKQGICHRDIKPENCLLDGNGNLKVSDFGLATVFKYKGQERLLKDRCGSPPYAAPELAHPAPYAAEPIDVWSSGVLLFALLVGNTPWDEPTQNSAEFCAFVDGTLLEMDPWSRIRGGTLDCLLKLLELNPSKRITISQLESLDWFTQYNPLFDSTTGLCKSGIEIFRRLASGLRSGGYVGQPGEEYQEMMRESEGMELGGNASQAMLSQRGIDVNASFRGSMQLYSRLSMAPTQASNSNLSRFFSTTPLDLLITALESALTSLSLPSEITPSPLYSAYEAERTGSGNRVPLSSLFARLRVKSKDKRGMPLEFAIHFNKGWLPGEGFAGRGGIALTHGIYAKKNSKGNKGKTAKSGLSQSIQGMNLDSDDEDDEGESEEEEMEVSEEQEREEKLKYEEEMGTNGVDVTLWKKNAEPIELKKVWKLVLARLPSDYVTVT